MEMKQDLQYLKKWLGLILGFGLITGIISFAIMHYRAPMYQGVITYEINLVNRPSTKDYQYGAYYDLKGSELLVQHLMSLLRSPSVISEIYQQANLNYTVENLAQFTNQFRTDQGSSQEFTVTFSQYQLSETEILARAITTVLTDRTAAVQQDSSGQSLFQLQASDPVTIYQKTNPWLAGSVGLVAGWLLAVVIIYLKRYLQS